MDNFSLLGGGDFLPFPSNEEATTEQRMLLTEMPNLVLLNLLKFLDSNSLYRMRLTCRKMHELIDYHFGIELDIRQEYDWYVTDEMLRAMWIEMRSKMVRSLTMVDVPLELITQNNQPVIPNPGLLERVSFSFMDAKLVHEALTECKKLRSFSYESYEGGRARLPKMNQEFVAFIEELPEFKVPLNQLTSIDLSLEMVNGDLRLSDWANIVFILLAIPDTPSLRKFKLHVNLENISFGYHTNCVLQACLSQFLKNRPSLVDLFIDLLGNNNEDLPEILELPHSVISCLCRKYGTSELKGILETWAPDVVQRRTRTMTSNAGRALTKLRNLDVNLDAGREATLAIMSFIEALRSITRCTIHNTDERERDEEVEQYTISWRFLAPGKAFPPLPMFQTLHTLSVKYSHARHSMTPLLVNDLLKKMPKLTSLVIVDEGWIWEETPPNVENFLHVEDPFDPLLEAVGAVRVRWHDQNYIQRPTLRILSEDDMTPFKRLKKLKLMGVCAPVQDMDNLVNCSNLESLSLEIRAGFHNQSFGILPETVLLLMGTLRKLNKMLVECILLPPPERETFLRYKYIFECCGTVTSQRDYWNEETIMHVFTFTFANY